MEIEFKLNYSKYIKCCKKSHLFLSMMYQFINLRNNELCHLPTLPVMPLNPFLGICFMISSVIPSSSNRHCNVSLLLSLYIVLSNSTSVTLLSTLFEDLIFLFTEWFVDITLDEHFCPLVGVLTLICLSFSVHTKGGGHIWHTPHYGHLPFCLVLCSSHTPW